MNYDSFADIGRGIARGNDRIERGEGAGTGGSPAVAARWLVSLAVALAAAWAVVYGAPAFGGLFVVAAVGFAAVWMMPWLVVTGVVRALEAAE